MWFWVLGARGSIGNYSWRIRRFKRMVSWWLHWKINMEPKNGGLEDDSPFQLGDFRFHVHFERCEVGDWCVTCLGISNHSFYKIKCAYFPFHQRKKIIHRWPHLYRRFIFQNVTLWGAENLRSRWWQVQLPGLGGSKGRFAGSGGWYAAIGNGWFLGERNLSWR